MLTLIDNSKKAKIIGFFLDNPTTPLHLRSLSRRIKVSPTWISKKIDGLVKEGLITVSKNKETKILTMKADRENSEFNRLKKSHNLYQIYKSGLIDQIIENYQKPEAIILFGSYSRGEDIEKSDIDLAIITTRKIQNNLDKFEQKLNRKIKIIELKKDKIEKEFQNTLANGVVLYGYLDIIK
tara:strand:- start:2414 stop:2959 length:546 start_codon:yes stop_codon:yes gene_type:complete